MSSGFLNEGLCLKMTKFDFKMIKKKMYSFKSWLHNSSTLKYLESYLKKPSWNSIYLSRSSSNNDAHTCCWSQSVKYATLLAVKKYGISRRMMSAQWAGRGAERGPWFNPSNWFMALWHFFFKVYICQQRRHGPTRHGSFKKHFLFYGNFKMKYLLNFFWHTDAERD